LEHTIEGKIEGTGRRGRTHMQLLDDLNETRGYWKLEEDRTDRFLENSLWEKQWSCSDKAD